VTSLGTVRHFRSDEGWGVIDSPDTPGGCWVHFSAIPGDGYLRLTAGETVRFEAEAVDQDGYPYRATAVWPAADVDVADDRPRSSPYSSTLRITVDPPDPAG
jgi:cold shock protein